MLVMMKVSQCITYIESLLTGKGVTIYLDGWMDGLRLKVYLSIAIKTKQGSLMQ